MKSYLIEAINFLRPDAEFIFVDDDYSTIQWSVLSGDAPTQSEIEAAIKQIKADELSANQAKASAKAALLERLGITADEATLLLS